MKRDYTIHLTKLFTKYLVYRVVDCKVLWMQKFHYLEYTGVNKQATNSYRKLRSQILESN